MVPATTASSPPSALIPDGPLDGPRLSAVIVVSPSAHLEITPSVDGTGHTHLTVREGDNQATVSLRPLLVDETCYQLAINSPISVWPEPGPLNPDAADSGNHGAELAEPADPGTLTVVPLPELDGRPVIDTPQVQTSVAPDVPGYSRLTVRHAGALHTVTLPDHVLDDLLDRHRRRLIDAAWQAALTVPAAPPSGGER